MKAFTVHTGKVVAIDRANVDTDQIIPKQFLKRIERTGFGEFLFWDWARKDDGTPNPDFELNKPGRGGFDPSCPTKLWVWFEPRACPLGIEDYGFRVIIAPSFADIFYNNCFKNGMLPIRLSEEQVEELFQRAAQHHPYALTADLEEEKLSDAHGFFAKIEVEPFRRNCLLNGLDDIGLTLEHEAKITAYEAAHA